MIASGIKKNGDSDSYRRNINLIVAIPVDGGGTIYSNGFFVQTILADRYINRRELRLVLLQSLSSVEYGITKNFVYFRFLQGAIEVYTLERRG